MPKNEYEGPTEDIEEEHVGEGVYSRKKRGEMLDSDEISCEEEAFMQGYEEA